MCALMALYGMYANPAPINGNEFWTPLGALQVEYHGAQDITECQPVCVCFCVCMWRFYTI